MNILLTGGTGFIGQRLLKYLATQEHSIHLLSRRLVKDYSNTYCDFLKDKIPEDVFSKNSIETVIHLAGFAHDTRDQNKIENLYNRLNVSVSVELANLAVKSGVKRFVFVSSVKAGGTYPYGVIANEKIQSNTEDIYGKTKREAELRLLEIGQLSGMHISIIRPSLVYGPDVKGNLKQMLHGIKKGWFPPLPETGNRRSMIHVDDLVRAILLVAEDKRANREIFIATDGTPYSSRKIYNTMCDLTGKLIPKWSVPKSIFNLAGLLIPSIKYKINKLLGDECFSSDKLEALGFKAKKSLKDMNETDF